jgi:hypothetical protein
MSDDAYAEAEDGLFRTAPAAFVAARNDLAARLKAAGRRDHAARVKALARPTVTAWAVNQLFWSARDFLERLLDAGDALRAAQQAGGDELREAMRARRDALATARDRALAFLREGGQATSPALEQRLTNTLLALATHGRRLPAGIALGRFDGDLEPPGFEALDGLTLPEIAPLAPGPTQAVTSGGAQADDRPPGAADADEVERAERAAEAARRAAEVERCRAEHEAAALGLRHAEGEVATAQAAVGAARSALTRAEEALRAAEAARTRAREVLDRAQAALVQLQSNTRRPN